MTRERALELALQTFVMIESGDFGQRRARPAFPSEHAELIANAILDAVNEERAKCVEIADAVAVVAEAIAEEREACAKVAERADGISGDDKWDCCAEHIRDEIRERGIPLKVGA